MTLVGLAKPSHPELEQPDVVFLAWPCSTQQDQDFLGVLSPSPIHLRELEQDLDFAGKMRITYEEAYKWGNLSKAK